MLRHVSKTLSLVQVKVGRSWKGLEDTVSRQAECQGGLIKVRKMFFDAGEKKTLCM